MPEFPDVTVYIEALSERVLNQPIQKIRIGSPFVLRSFSPPIGAAEGKRVLALRRLGKRIVFELEDELYLIVHLMIAGRFHWKPKGAKIARKYGQAAFDFPNGTLLLTEAGNQEARVDSPGMTEKPRCKSMIQAVWSSSMRASNNSAKR